MSNLKFAALDILGKNYFHWALDTEIHLDAKNLGNTIKEGNDASQQDRAKALIFLHRHIDERLKGEYLTIKDPFVLWNNLKERYDHHQKTIILQKAYNDWMHLRLQDFKSVSDYNSTLLNIRSQLELCGEKVTEEDMLEKTFTTFHVSNILLQQQYRECHFTKYSELISCLLVAEQNNELLLKNHQSRPTGSMSLLEANATYVQTYGHGPRHVYGRGRGRGRSPNPNCGRHNSSHRSGYHHFKRRKNNSNHQKWNNSKARLEKSVEPQSKHTHETECYRCGMTGHWSRTCCTSKHLVDLYQASIKAKEKDIEMNFSDADDLVDLTHFDFSDFFEDPDGKIDHLIGDGNVCSN